MRRPSGALWGHADFMKLWTGQSISEFGSQISALAIPLLALLDLGDPRAAPGAKTRHEPELASAVAHVQSKLRGAVSEATLHDALQARPER